MLEELELKELTDGPGKNSRHNTKFYQYCKALAKIVNKHKEYERI